jgi:hypothetical protein
VIDYYHLICRENNYCSVYLVGGPFRLYLGEVLMKSFASSFVILSIIAMSFSPALAQRSSETKVIAKSALSTQFERIQAVSDGNGVLVRWEMEAETANAGFFVYRTGKGGLELVNETMTVGSAGRSMHDTLFGTTYEILDLQGGFNTHYVVEAVQLSGIRISSGTVGVEYSNNIKTTGGSTLFEMAAAHRFRQQELVSERPSLPEDLNSIVSAAVQQPDLEMHRWVTGLPGAKIGIRKEGLVRVMRAQLPAATFNGSNTDNWRLFCEGNEQPIIVGPNGDYIEFFARGVDTVESDTRMYYLINGPGIGKRMTTKVIRPIAGVVPTNGYRQLFEKKERSSYINSIINGPLDNYWGRIVTNSPTTITFQLSSIDLEQKKVPVELKMQGYSNTPHGVAVTINGRNLGIVSGSGIGPFSGQLTVNASNLITGTNTLVLATTASNDFSLFDSVTLNYGRKYAAEAGSVFFYTPGYRKVDLTGFATATPRLFDTTYDGNVQEVIGLPIVPENGSYTIKMPSHRPSTFYAVEDSAILTPATVGVNTPSSLATPNNSANFIIISHSSPDFMAAAETWANYRRSPAGGNFNVKVVDVADIFDEFNYGVLSSKSLNDFLLYAHTNWQQVPQYVLIIGDASYDPRNYEGHGYWDLVPSQMTNLIYAESASDEALADFDNDGLAEMAIGRIPARTANHITTIFNKTLAFETPEMQSLSRGSLFAYDLPNGFDFAAMSQMLRNELPITMPNAYVDRGAANAQTTLINQINLGRYIVNYSGHGSSGVWAATSFFGNNNVPQLTNASSQSIFTALTCLNGYFIRPEVDSLAEVLLKAPNGGAAIVWASTEKTTPDIQLMMGMRFFNQVKVGSITRMGDLVRDAKVVIPGGSDVRLSWALFGDPATKVR